jgi:uncharacterized BrkB/YihY/UPF0761 family membrane protein
MSEPANALDAIPKIVDNIKTQTANLTIFFSFLLSAWTFADLACGQYGADVF